MEQLQIQTDDKKVPAFAKQPYFDKILETIEKSIISDEKQSIRKLADELNLSFQWIYKVLSHEYTQKKIEEIVKSNGTLDTGKVYQTILDNRRNPRHSELFLKYFSPIKPVETQQGGNIMINIGLFGANKSDNVTDAEYVDITLDDKSNKNNE
jgi:hypothetical protein